MKLFAHVGFNNWVRSDQIVTAQLPNSAPAVRFVQEARQHNILIDMTQGRKTKTVLVLASGQVVLSALSPDTITGRVENGSVVNSKPTGEVNNG